MGRAVFRMTFRVMKIPEFAEDINLDVANHNEQFHPVLNCLPSGVLIFINFADEILSYSLWRLKVIGPCKL